MNGNKLNGYLKNAFIGAFCLGSISLQAQEVNQLALSLDSAVNFAVKHNRTLINSRFSIDKSSQKLKETISQGLPQISASVDYSNFLGAEAELKLSDMAPPVVIEFNPTSNFKLSATQLVFNGGYYVGIQMSNLAKTLSEQSYIKDEITVKEQVIQAYYMVLASERILETIKENKANAQVIYEKTRNLVNAGLLEQTDEKKLSIMLKSVDNAMKSTERQVEMGYNLLRLQIGLESGEPIVLKSNIDSIAQKCVLLHSIVSPFDINNNMDFKLVSLQGDMAKKQVLLKRASYLPSIVAFYSYTEKLQKPAFDMSPKQVLGFTLTVPIFSSGQRQSQLNQAKIDYSISQNSKDLVFQQLTLQERQLRFTFNNLYEQLSTQKANVEIAKEVLDKMNLKYQQGVVSSLELTSANSEYLNAETTYTSLMLQLLNAELSLRKINSNL